MQIGSCDIYRGEDAEGTFLKTTLPGGRYLISRGNIFHDILHCCVAVWLGWFVSPALFQQAYPEAKVHCDLIAHEEHLITWIEIQLEQHKKVEQ